MTKWIVLVVAGFILVDIIGCESSNKLAVKIVSLTDTHIDRFHRFTGHLRFPVDEDLSIWKCTVTFSKPVGAVTVQPGDILSHTDTIINIVSNSRFPMIKKNQTLDILITGSVVDGSAPSASGSLINLAYDGMTNPTVVQLNGTKYNYNEVLEKSILFYEAQRSGKLPANNRIPWRGDSALLDQGDNGEDLSGGWYDAGSNLKFGFPVAASVTFLNWGLLKYHDAYESSGELDNMYDSVRWPLEYLLKCHTSPNVLYSQISSTSKDLNSWDRPESITYVRHLLQINETHPGSELAAEFAAAMASGYLVFKDKDPTFSAKLLEHAKQLYNFSQTYVGKYSESLASPDTANFYKSYAHEDEREWAGAWLYKATNDKSYLKQAEEHRIGGFPSWAVSWDDKTLPSQILLYELTKDNFYKQEILRSLDSWLPPNPTVTYTPKGLAWRDQWGTLRYAANTAFMALLAAENDLNPIKYRCWAKSQIHYMLGDAGRSYVVGFGHNPPVHIHHRAASCPMKPAPCGWSYFNSKNPDPHVLYGALVGGPDKHDVYHDARNDYIHDEVAIDFNAGFQSAVAANHSICSGYQYIASNAGHGHAMDFLDRAVGYQFVAHC